MHWKKYLKTIKLKQNDRCRLVSKRKLLSQTAEKPGNGARQLDLKRRQGRIQQELKDKIFEEAYALVNDYMKTAEYDDFLLRCIHNAIVFTNGEEMTINLNPSDEEKRSSLEDATGIHLTISAEDFTGGIRAVIRSRNILIDHSFKTALRNEYDKFLFSGGDSIV